MGSRGFYTQQVRISAPVINDSCILIWNYTAWGKLQQNGEIKKKIGRAAVRKWMYLSIPIMQPLASN